jgi:hypothetical protein
MKAKETKMRTSVTKKTLLLALLLATSSTWAGWVLVAQTNNIDSYIDPSTIRNDGVMRKLWVIKDLKQRNSSGWMSVRVRQEYDCKEERYRSLSSSLYAEPMAGGTVMFAQNLEKPDSWIHIPPGTDAEAIMKTVCAR